MNIHGLHRLVISCVLSSAVVACNGQLYHGVAGNPDVTSACGQKVAVQCGVPYNRLVTGIQTSRSTVRVDDKGKVIATETGRLTDGSTTDRCEPVISQEVATVADTMHPEMLWYEPGILETVKFNATFNTNGTLASVGTEATPDQGRTFQNVASGLSSLVMAIAPLAGGAPKTPTGGRGPTVTAVPRPALPACNSGPIVISFRPVTL